MAAAAEAFFARLPVRLSEDEQELVAQLERVGKFAQRLLPPCVTLQAWAERRLLETDGTRANASGLVYVAIGKCPSTTQDRPSGADRDRDRDRDHREREVILAEPRGERDRAQERGGDHRSQREEKGQERERGGGAGDRDRDRKPERDRRPSERPQERPSDRRASGDVQPSRSGREHYQLTQEEFYAALPREGLSRDEQALRDAMVKVLTSWRGSALPLLAEVAQDRQVDAGMRQLLPKDVSLRNWCATRVSSEIQLAETRHNNEYTYTVGLVRSRRPEPPKVAAPLPSRAREAPPPSRAGGERVELVVRPAPTPRPPPRSPSPGARSRSNSVVWSQHSRSRSPHRMPARSRSRSEQRLHITMPHNEQSFEGEQVEAVVHERPAQASGEPIWQAEIEMAQGGTNHSGRARTFNIRGPPRKSKEAADEDAAALTRVSAQGPKVVRGVVNNMHRG